MIKEGKIDYVLNSDETLEAFNFCVVARPVKSTLNKFVFLEIFIFLAATNEIYIRMLSSGILFFMAQNKASFSTLTYLLGNISELM